VIIDTGGDGRPPGKRARDRYANVRARLVETAGTWGGQTGRSIVSVYLVKGSDLQWFPPEDLTLLEIHAHGVADPVIVVDTTAVKVIGAEKVHDPGTDLGRTRVRCRARLQSIKINNKTPLEHGRAFQDIMIVIEPRR
jgi:hypothetical protein